MENNNNIYNNNNFNGNYYNMAQGGIYVQQPMVQQQQPKNNIKYFDELFRKKSDGILQRGPFWKIHLTYLFIRIAIFLPLLLIAYRLDVSFMDVSFFDLMLILVVILWIILSIPATIYLKVRRLHDANFSGYALFASFIPGIGSVIVLVLLCMPSNYNCNEYVPNYINTYPYPVQRITGNQYPYMPYYNNCNNGIYNQVPNMQNNMSQQPQYNPNIYNNNHK